MSTITSNANLLCPVTEFLKRNDPRTVGMLATTTTVAVTEAALATDVRLIAALTDASAEVESAALKGEKYSADDLVLVVDCGKMAAGKLYRVVSDIAWAYLWENRQNKAFDVPPPPSLERSLFMLDELAKGVRIFGLVENAQAGHMDI